METDLPGCLVFEPKVFGDDRGYFFESFNLDKLAAHGLQPAFVQGNVSMSRGGVLRGLHYQWPKPQGKYVTVLEGEVWDVAVDIRRGSPTFGRWAAVVLSGENRRHNRERRCLFHLVRSGESRLAILNERRRQ